MTFFAGPQAPAGRSKTGLRGLACALIPALALLAGCSGSERNRAEGPPPAAPFAEVARQDARAQENGPKLAYRHDLTVALAPDRVEPHFAAARDRCLTDAALTCTLLQSSIRGGSGTSQP